MGGGGSGHMRGYSGGFPGHRSPTGFETGSDLRERLDLDLSFVFLPPLQDYKNAQ